MIKAWTRVTNCCFGIELCIDRRRFNWKKQLLRMVFAWLVKLNLLSITKPRFLTSPEGSVQTPSSNWSAAKLDGEFFREKGMNWVLLGLSFKWLSFLKEEIAKKALIILLQATASLLMLPLSSLKLTQNGVSSA